MYRKKKQHFMMREIVIFLAIILISISVTGLVNRGYDLTVETDKPQYYPGEEVIIFGWLTENGTGVPMSGVCINVTDPEEYQILGGCMLTNETGYYEVIITLEPTAVLGVYEVLVHSVEFDIDAETTFEVIIENDPPNKPTIDGPTTGTAGEEYDYTFVTTDPNEDDVYYWIVWDDGCPAVEWIGPYDSGEEVIVSHTFDDEGTYTISAKAKDIHEAESDWGTLDVEMPVSQQLFNLRLFQFLQSFIDRFPILRQIFSLSPFFSVIFDL